MLLGKSGKRLDNHCLVVFGARSATKIVFIDIRLVVVFDEEDEY